jgi:hypothetical protein
MGICISSLTKRQSIDTNSSGLRARRAPVSVPVPVPASVSVPRQELEDQSVFVSADLPLNQYASLEYPFKHSRLVGLYFGALWCPMSSHPSNQLDQFFGDVLLPPPSSIKSPPIQRTPLSIVYVSSDKTEQQMIAYQKRNWISVPFDSDERTALKKEFSVCAERELSVLGMNERKYEIPTLVILDGETHGIITTNGVEDLEEYGSKALDHWMDLFHLIRALEDKYAKDY